MNNGFFITIEGIDGTGKTTLSKTITDKLTRVGYSVVLSREPTTGQYGQKIRESAKTGRLSLEDELSLFIEDRKEHIENTIKPSLAAGKIVILDRYFYSTMAYQGARGANADEIAKLHEEFAIIPNLLVMLKIDVDKALTRIAQSRDGADLFENHEYLSRVSENYDKISHPNIFVVNADQPMDTVANLVCKKILDELNHIDSTN